MTNTGKRTAANKLCVKYFLTSSFAVAKRSHDASCLSVISFAASIVP